MPSSPETAYRAVDVGILMQTIDSEIADSINQNQSLNPSRGRNAIKTLLSIWKIYTIKIVPT